MFMDALTRKGGSNIVNELNPSMNTSFPPSKQSGPLPEKSVISVAQIGGSHSDKTIPRLAVSKSNRATFPAVALASTRVPSYSIGCNVRS
jgi:hypothetical protein